MNKFYRKNKFILFLIGLIVLMSFYIIPLMNVLATEKAYDLFKTHKCLACHAFDKTLVGPSYNDVAERYKDSPDITISVLGAKLRDGGNGAWGVIPMPPMSLHRAESEYLVQWILKKRWKE